MYKELDGDRENFFSLQISQSQSIVLSQLN